jgi:hypothetical protein
MGKTQKKRYVFIYKLPTQVLFFLNVILSDEDVKAIDEQIERAIRNLVRRLKPASAFLLLFLEHFHSCFVPSLSWLQIFVYHNAVTALKQGRPRYVFCRSTRPCPT